MAAILGKLLTKNRQFQMLITFEPFVRFLQMKAQHSLSPTIWSDIVVGRESGYLKIFFTFLEVNMSNIL